jgi:hypothetical protein
MSEQLVSLWGPGVERRHISEEQGLGLFAARDIEAEELLGVKSGALVSTDFVLANAPMIQGSHVEFRQGLHLAPRHAHERLTTLLGYNHSCDPNAYVAEPGTILRAMRRIKGGEQITVDYATAYASPTQEFDCLCQSSNCRGHVQSSEDWKDPEIQAKYDGYFAPYLQEMIKRAAA